MSEHAPLAPSFAPVWGHCSGAVMAAMRHPNVETQENRTGTAAHWVVSEVLLTFKGQRDGGKLLAGDYVGDTAPNDVVIDDAMAEGAQVMIDEVLQVVQKHGAMQSLLVEFRVHAPHIHEQNWGTLDVSLYLPDRKVLFLWDYKHGHRENSAEGNLQLINYAEGLRVTYQIDGVLDQQLTVVMRIVQPFCYRANGPVDEWVCKLADLRGYANQLHAKANEAFTNPTLTSGKHCRDCPAVGRCAASRKAAYNLIDVANRPYGMDDMTAAQLATERLILLDGLAAAKKRLEAIEANITYRLENGEPDTGLTLEATYGRLAFTIPDKQAAALAQQFGFSIEKYAIKTPTQAKQAAPKGVKDQYAAAIKNFTKRPPTGFKLVPAQDSRTARAFKPQRT